MEADILDRRKRRTRDRKEAEEFKLSGNHALQRGAYKTAIKYYSDALDLKKDMLCLYTNRALARLKVEEWTGAIDDCTRILEYCEVFHDGFLKE
jgi:tetratricopeptide (TPR) repeat protein